MNYKYLKKKIKQCHVRCLKEVNERNDTKEQMGKIREAAKINESGAVEDL